MGAINVKSEIGKLKKVLLHRPGAELLNLTPDTLSRLLFDDIPFLPEAQKDFSYKVIGVFSSYRDFIPVCFNNRIVAFVTGGKQQVFSRLRR